MANDPKNATMHVKMVKCKSWTEKTKPDALHMSKGAEEFQMALEYHTLDDSMAIPKAVWSLQTLLWLIFGHYDML